MNEESTSIVVCPHCGCEFAVRSPARQLATYSDEYDE